MDIAAGAIVFIFGAMIGSFLNVCILRLPEGRSIVTGGSACPACAARLKPAELVPIVSYLALRGRCRHCGARISPQYITVETLTGALFTLLYVKLGPVWQLPVYMALFALLIAVSAIDLKTMEIPNGLVIAGFIVGGAQLAAAVFTDVFGSWLELAIGLLAGGVPLLLIALIAAAVLKRDAMGGGDIKLMAFCGLVIGWRLVIPAYLIGIAAGALGGVILMAAGKKKRGDEIPFGPFLALGVVVSVFFGTALIDWYVGLIT